MKLYRITLRESVCDNYRGFIVASTSTPDVVEEVYKFVCLDSQGKIKRDIPYCLRSSNLKIEYIGTFSPADKLDSPVLLADFYDA